MIKASKSYLKSIRLLLREKEERDKSGSFVVEGAKTIRDAITKGYSFQNVLVTENLALQNDSQDIMTTLKKRKIDIYQASKKDYASLSTLMEPCEIMAVLRVRERKPDLSVKKLFGVLCDNIQDPGNLGAIIRTAAAFNVDFIILTGKPCDIYNPKVIRASSGTIMDIAIANYRYDYLNDIIGKGISVFAASNTYHNSKALDDIKVVPDRLIVAFGNEGYGLADEIIKISGETFRVPISANVESLNVAAAAAISIYYLQNKRVAL